jgi:hypothetical protein
MVGLEMFKESSFSEKLQIFFDICDEDGPGDIDEEEFYNVLKLCVNTPKEKKLLRESRHDLFIVIDEDGNGVLSKDEIIKTANQSEAMKTIIKKVLLLTRVLTRGLLMIFIICHWQFSMPNTLLIPYLHPNTLCSA